MPIPRIRLIPSLAAALALFLAVPAAAEDPPNPPVPAEPAKKPVLPWIDGWAKGVEAAKKSKKLLLVLLTQENPPSERSKMLDDKVFADPKAVEIAPRCVLVRMRGGDDSTPELQAFMRRYGVSAFPALFIMNADGHLLVPGMAYTVESVLKMLAWAENDEIDFAALATKTDPAERALYMEQLAHRMDWEELIGLLAPLAEKEPSVDLYMQLARAYQRSGKAAEERAVLTKLVEANATDPQRTRWRIRLATQPLDAVAGDEEAFHMATVRALVPLSKALREEGDPPGEAEVRLCVADAYAYVHKCHEEMEEYERAKQDRAIAKREFEAVIQLAPEHWTAPKALLNWAAVAWYEIDYKTCRKLCERLIAEYPKSPEVKPARDTIKSCDERTAPPIKPPAETSPPETPPVPGPK